MCGRYLLRHMPDEVHTPWKVYWKDIQLFQPRFNIGPGQSAPVIVADAGEWIVRPLTWGFRPHWAKKSYAKINATAENLFDSKMFKHSALHRRCLVLADGFYEPKGPKEKKYRPWYVFQFNNSRPFAFAGIWTSFKSDTEADYDNFTIITCEPNSQIAPVHDRIPVLFDTEHWELAEQWIDSSVNDIATLKQVLQPREYLSMHSYRVPDHAKNPRNEGPSCIERVNESE